ncbi:hypothetical protein PTKIN_Ptkin01aG0369500 [Pterospermum kingtungense]
MEGDRILIVISLLALVFSFATASDPNPVQDFCVGVATKDAKNGVLVNGKFCKDPKYAKAEDFFFSGLNMPGNTSNQQGSKAPYGLNPPHTHPRATEILVVLQGTLYVGFVTSNKDNRLFTKVLYPGYVFVFPIGLIHFQFNIGKTNAVAFAGLSNQNPGMITIANAVFGSKGPINPDVLAKAFHLDKNAVTFRRSRSLYVDFEFVIRLQFVYKFGPMLRCMVKENPLVAFAIVLGLGTVIDGLHKPPALAYKCNSNAALFFESGECGMGMVLRNDKGEMVACRVAKLPGTPEVCEVEALTRMKLLHGSIAWGMNMLFLSLILRLVAL